MRFVVIVSFSPIIQNSSASLSLLQLPLTETQQDQLLRHATVFVLCWHLLGCRCLWFLCTHTELLYLDADKKWFDTYYFLGSLTLQILRLRVRLYKFIMLPIHLQNHSSYSFPLPLTWLQSFSLRNIFCTSHCVEWWIFKSLYVTENCPWRGHCLVGEAEY